MTVTTAVPTVEIELPVDRVSIARLHGEACISCGCTALPLMPNGHVGTRGSEDGILSWPVVACPACCGAHALNTQQATADRPFDREYLPCPNPL